MDKQFQKEVRENYENSKRHFVYDWNISTGVYEVRSIQIDGNPHCISLSEKNVIVKNGLICTSRVHMS